MLFVLFMLPHEQIDFNNRKILDVNAVLRRNRPQDREHRFQVVFIDDGVPRLEDACDGRVGRLSVIFFFDNFYRSL